MRNTVIMSHTVISSFIEYLEVSPLTVRAYKAGISRFIGFLRCKGIARPNREDVVSFKHTLSDCGCKPATIAAYLCALRRFFGWTEVQGLYPDITRGIKAPKIDKGHKRDFLPAAGLKAMMQGIDRRTLEGKRNYAVLAVMSTCGLRTVEVIRADIADVSTIGGETVLYVQGKGRTDKKEFVKLTPPVLAAVRDYLHERGQAGKDAPLFASCSRRNRGGRLTTRTISGIAKASMSKAGYASDRLTAHSLRHSAVTLALMSGSALAEVQYFARHSSINTTMIYAHNVDRLKSRCEAALTAAVFGTCPAKPPVET